MPVETAFAALRDPNGDVTLHLALAAPGPGDTRTFPDAVARAVRDAVARGGQGLLPDEPLRIAFAPGRAELTASGAQQIATIAKILDARPNLVVELAAPVSTDDRRWLAARALADDIEPARGFKGVLRTFGYPRPARAHSAGARGAHRRTARPARRGRRGRAPGHARAPSTGRRGPPRCPRRSARDARDDRACRPPRHRAGARRGRRCRAGRQRRVPRGPWQNRGRSSRRAALGSRAGVGGDDLRGAVRRWPRVEAPPAGRALERRRPWSSSPASS